MTLEEKDKYIADHLMKLSAETLRYMVADLSAEVERLSKGPWCTLRDAEKACGTHFCKGLERAAEIAESKGLNQDCFGEPSGYYKYGKKVAEGIAAAIRAEAVRP